MRSQFNKRLRSASLSAIPPPQSSEDYSPPLADLAAHIIYRSPLPSQDDLSVFILNAAALPDIDSIDYDSLLPYVLARLPDEDELIGGKGYEVVFFAGGEERGATTVKKGRPRWGWFLQAYHVLSRAMRKRLQKLYIVHEKTWIRVMVEMFSTIVSPKFRRKVIHVSSLSALALYIPIENLLIPPSAYHYDRCVCPYIHVPYATGKRAFGLRTPLPMSSAGIPRLPRVLREATSFLLMDQMPKTDGVFRISARAVTLSILKEAYDRGQKFIVWREDDSVLTFGTWKAGSGHIMVEELRHTEGLGIYAAAGLIKLWYAELSEPIFPQASYEFLERAFGFHETPIETSQLLDLIGEDSDWSRVSRMSRQILRMHLLPMLATIARHKDWNQMTAHNLAICLAPSMVHGSDPLEDVKITRVIRRILEFAIELWDSGLSDLCGMDKWKFENSLRVPEATEDREDPLEQTILNTPTWDAQVDGITLVDNDDSEEDSDDLKPILPPRPIAPSDTGEISLTTTTLRRKPAPPMQSPPRYSTIITQEPVGLNRLPAYEESSIEQVNAPTESSVPVQSPTTVVRKPLPKGTGNR